MKEMIGRLASLADDIRLNWGSGNIDLVREQTNALVGFASELGDSPEMKALKKAYYGGLWLIQSSGEHLRELANEDVPDAAAFEAALAFVDSGVEQVLRETA
jgi:hypothetical protein